MKVLIQIPAEMNTEPNQESSFISGYESAGGTWSGEILISSTDQPLFEPSEDMDAALEYAYQNGVTLFTRPSNGSTYNGLIDKYYELGIQCVMPAGDNAYESIPFDSTLKRAVIIGAGRDINQTGRYIEFFDQDPAHIIRNIANLSQSGSKAFVQGNNIGGNPDASGVNLYFVNWAVLIEGVTGFQHNPSGVYKITDFIDDGWYNKYKFTFNLGTGSYTGGGTARMDFSSNSGPYIAGKMAFIKDTLNCSWWEARYRMRKTASNSESYTTANGYGIPDAAAAIEFEGVIIADPGKVIGSVGNISVQRYSEDHVGININAVDNAAEYEIFENGELLTTKFPTIHNTGIIPHHFTIKRRYKSEGGHHYKYRALRGSQYTAFSSEKKVNYLNFKQFLYK